MRFVLLLLTICLLPASGARAADVFVDFLYWRTSEPVDWVLNTNRVPSDQFVEYRATEYSFTPGWRIGVSNSAEWDTRFYYTQHRSSGQDSAAGFLTGAFLGAKNSQPPSPKTYFDTGAIDSEIDYHMFDWDLGQRFYPTSRVMFRPIVGLRGGWIDQSYRMQFEASYTDGNDSVDRTVVENAVNNFWGIGPKVGFETAINFLDSPRLEVNGVFNFHMAYLVGHWDVRDVTTTTDVSTTTTVSTDTILVDDREFGSLAFQAVVGLNVRYKCCSVTAGYELNDWLNQGQLFTDASGPQNNDLLLQGLTVNVLYTF